MPNSTAPDDSIIYKSRSRRALAVKQHGPDSSEAQNAKRDLAAAKLEREVQRVLAAAPPMTDVQRQRIAALLLAGG